jgi:hypothetical protein
MNTTTALASATRIGRRTIGVAIRLDAALEKRDLLVHIL